MADEVEVSVSLDGKLTKGSIDPSSTYAAIWAATALFKRNNKVLQWPAIWTNKKDHRRVLSIFRSDGPDGPTERIVWVRPSASYVLIGPR